MKSRLLLGDYVKQKVRILPFLSDDVLKIVSIVTRRGTTNRIEVVRTGDGQFGWIDEDNLIKTEKYL